MLKFAPGMALRIAGVYVVLAALWIVCSDWLLTTWIQNTEQLTSLQIYKGWGFVLITGILLYLITHRQFATMTRMHTRQMDIELKNRFLAEQLQQNLSASPAMTHIHRVDGRELMPVWISQNVTQFLGYPVSETLTPRWWEDHIIPEDHDRVMSSLTKLFDKDTLVMEYQFLRKDGSQFWMRDERRLIRDQYGMPTRRVVGTWTDITERKQAELTLRESEDRYRNLVENAPDAILINLEKRVVMVNKACIELFGAQKAEDLLGLSPFDLFHLDDHVQIRERIDRACTLGENAPLLNERIVRLDGQCVDVEVSAAPFQFQGKTALHVTIRDITERQQTERELGTLHNLSMQMRKAEHLTDVLPIVLKQVLQALHADTGCVMLLSDDGNELTVEQGDGDWAPSIGKTFAVSQRVKMELVRDGNPLAITDHREQLADLPPLIMGNGPVVVVPLRSENAPMGLLAIGRQNEPDGAPFTSSNIRLLKTIGEMSGNAMRRLHLLDDATERLNRVQALRQIDMAITGSLDRRVTLNVVLEQVTTQLRVDAASILLTSPITQTLEYEAGRGFYSNAIEQSKLRFEQGYAGQAASKRQLVSVPNLKQAEPPLLRDDLLANENFATYHAIPMIAKGQVVGVLETFHRQLFKPNREWLDFLDALAGQAAIAVEDARLFTNMEHANRELLQAYEQTIEGWSLAMDFRDHETEGHTLRVTEMTVRLAKAMSINEAEIVHIRRGALLHDMGKIGVPDDVLLKPGKLTDDEWAIMKKHPQYAYEMLAPITYLRPSLDIPYCHHEKWDGTGYPRGLKGKQIPLPARLFAVVDVWDALRSDRPYRKAWPEDKVLDHIQQNANSHFDPEAVNIFLREQRNGQPACTTSN
jgi:PAS domain S-box-containing protein